MELDISTDYLLRLIGEKELEKSILKDTISQLQSKIEALAKAIAELQAVTPAQPVVESVKPGRGRSRTNG